MREIGVVVSEARTSYAPVIIFKEAEHYVREEALVQGFLTNRPSRCVFCYNKEAKTTHLPEARRRSSQDHGS